MDAYAILGVEPDTPPEEIRARWRALAQQYHPDGFATESEADQRQAADRMTVINAAYEDIRSGRAQRPPPGPRRDAPGAGRPHQPSRDPFDASVLEDAVRLLQQRRRANNRRQALRLAGALAGLAVLALVVHLLLSRSYGYDVVWDGSGATYYDVDCGSHYDQGATTARELRERAAFSSSQADLLYQADVIEGVCARPELTAAAWVGGLLGLAIIYFAWRPARRSRRGW